MRIDTPGIYTAISADDYHADPCPEPSLSSSVGRLLLNRSPLHAWTSHPRLNPEFDRSDESRNADIGKAVHKLVLGKGGEIVEVEAANFQTKAAKEDRDAAYAAGRIPLLSKDMKVVHAMAKAAIDYLRAFVPDLLGNGCLSEAVAVWCEGDAWCRSMIDRMTSDGLKVLDIKTTSTTARADLVTRHVFDMGYHFQAAFYERGLNQLLPEHIGRRRFLFLFQENEPPYACQLIRLDEAAMTIARKQVMATVALWQHCIATGEWPGYPPGIQTVTMPEWQQRAWLAREMADPSLTGDIGLPPEPESNKAMEWTI